MRKVRLKSILTPKNGHDIILCSHKRISQKYEEGFDDDDIATPQSADVNSCSEICRPTFRMLFARPF